MKNIVPVYLIPQQNREAVLLIQTCSTCYEIYKLKMCCSVKKERYNLACLLPMVFV